MKKILLLPFLLLLLVSNSCHKEIKSEKGGIDIISNVYINASKDLNQLQSFHLSKINYSRDTIIELVPDFTFPEINKQVYFIKDSLCFPLETENNTLIFSEISKKQKPNLIWSKKNGAIFFFFFIPN